MPRSGCLRITVTAPQIATVILLPPGSDIDGGMKRVFATAVSCQSLVVPTPSPNGAWLWGLPTVAHLDRSLDTETVVADLVRVRDSQRFATHPDATIHSPALCRHEPHGIHIHSSDEDGGACPAPALSCLELPLLTMMVAHGCGRCDEVHSPYTSHVTYMCNQLNWCL